MKGYYCKNTTNNIINILLIVNNETTRNNIDFFIRTIYLLVSYISQKANVFIDIITIYPKFYKRHFNNNFLINLHKINRCKKPKVFIQLNEITTKNIIKIFNNNYNLIITYDRDANIDYKSIYNQYLKQSNIINECIIMDTHNNYYIKSNVNNILENLNIKNIHDNLILFTSFILEKILKNKNLSLSPIYATIYYDNIINIHNNEIITNELNNIIDILKYILFDIVHINTKINNITFTQIDCNILFEIKKYIYELSKNKLSINERIYINTIHYYLGRSLHFLIINNNNYKFENIEINNIRDDKLVEIYKSLKYLSNKIPYVVRRSLNSYYDKKRNLNIIDNIFNKISNSYDKINDYIKYLDDDFEDIIDINDYGIYTSIITMSNWIDELKEGNCTGLNMHVYTNLYEKGRYNIELINVPSSIGNVIEMFDTLKEQYSIDISTHSITEDSINGKSNVVIPLYINKFHWELAKHYLNPICNIILHNSINIDNKSAWKLIYMLLIDMSVYVLSSINNVKLIKYYFSLWLTTNILSKENGYDKGLNKYILDCKKNNKYIDPAMISGQIISTQYNISTELIDYIKKLIIRNKLMEIKDIFKDCIKNKDEIIKIVEDTMTLTLSRVICLDKLSIIFKNKKNLSETLKDNYGLPSQELINIIRKEFSNFNIKNEIDKYILNLDTYVSIQDNDINFTDLLLK